MSAPNAESPLSLRYLGTAGFVLELGGRTLVLDPFVTRPGILRSLFGRLESDAELVGRLIPRADEVLVGHAHHDHILDAPTLCLQTGARLITSPSGVRVARAAGVPEAQLVQTLGREDIPCGAVTVRGLPSRHGRVYGRVPLKGEVHAHFRWPARLRHFRHGQVLNWFVEGAGIRVLHVDSADFIDEELQGLEVDVACLCAIGWKARPGYVERLVELVRPKVVIPCHWDRFWRPLDRPAKHLPWCDLAGFRARVEALGVACPHLELLGSWTWPATSPAGAGADVHG